VTPNEEQIGLLIRRFAHKASANETAGHLDADEMSAFAEGALPPAARARYVSHLAECDQCRRQVSDLSLAAGAIARTEQAVAAAPVPVGWWTKVSRLFAAPQLRYAAFAAMVLVVAGVTFIALRQRSAPRDLVATNKGEQPQIYDAQKSVSESNGDLKLDSSEARPPASTVSPANAAGLVEQTKKSGETQPEASRPADAITPATPPMKEAAKVEEAEKKSAETLTVQNKPDYAPAPPGEKQSVMQGQTGGYAAAPGGPRQQTQQADKSAVAVVDRERDLAKDARLDNAKRKSEQPPVLATRGVSDEKMKGGPSRNMDNVAANNRNSNEVLRTEPEKPATGAATEDRAETRSAGGHKFRRQGNSWVDQKFKSSMSVRTISRGSDEFASLDSGLRSIAQQVSGEVIIVWKGKAYLIK